MWYIYKKISGPVRRPVGGGGGPSQNVKISPSPGQKVWVDAKHAENFIVKVHKMTKPQTILWAQSYYILHIRKYVKKIMSGIYNPYIPYLFPKKIVPRGDYFFNPISEGGQQQKTTK